MSAKYAGPCKMFVYACRLCPWLVRAGELPEDYDFEAHKELVAMQPGNVPVTYADTTPLKKDFGFNLNNS